MSKRPPIDLMALTNLTAGDAVAMPEATQRSPMSEPTIKGAALKKDRPLPVAVDYSAPLNFKVSAEFRKRFRISAAKEGFKLNEFLFALFDAWESSQK